MRILLILLLLLFQTKQEIKVGAKNYKIIEKKTLYKDTIFYCENNVVIRKSDSIIHVYEKGKYKKWNVKK